MKTIIKFSIVILFTSNQLFAQKMMVKNKNVDGIFASFNDYKKGNLSCQINESNKLKLKQFFYSPFIVCREHDKKRVFFKDSIFAVHLTNGKSYRYINNTPCLIADSSNLLIYKYETVKTEYTTGPHRRAKVIPITYYYFSFGDHNRVYPLTINNLDKYVIPNPAAKSVIDTNFTTNERLSEIDPKTGHFKVNELIAIIQE
jgi:hypothetical protein